jgi:hypothetical protein
MQIDSDDILGIWDGRLETVCVIARAANVKGDDQSFGQLDDAQYIGAQPVSPSLLEFALQGLSISFGGRQPRMKDGIVTSL